MRIRTFILATCLLATLSGAGAAKTLRAGVFVGTNRGVFGEKKLFFANDDALKMFLAFSEYGGLDPSLGFLVKDARVDSIRTGISELGQRIQLLEKHSDATFECVFYFSGHGGSDGLHVDGQVYPYRKLYDDTHALGCELLVIILDACNSGNFLRIKGISFQEEEFRVKAYNTKKGEIFITSSAESEFSQEKDEFKGSVFTYYFVSGLLGAADMNQDNQITLSEVYGFASRRTVQETFGSARGFQVPGYKFELEGTQDAVLTEFGTDRQRIEVPSKIDGILTFMDKDKGIIWGDFRITGENRKVYLPKGSYLARLRDSAGKLHLAHCQAQSASNPQWTKFEIIPESEDPLKGRRIYHHWFMRVDGGLTWSADETLIRNVNRGGGVALLVDDLLFPGGYAGLDLGVHYGDRTEWIFDTRVSSTSWLFSAELLLGLSIEISEYFDLQGEIRLGGGYADLNRNFGDNSEGNNGAFFLAGIQEQAVWWISSGLGLVVPAVHAFLLAYGDDDGVQTRFGLGVKAGVQLMF